MKKYLRLGCNVCKRVIDKLVDNERVEPDRCTITLNCLGRLLPLEYRSNSEIATTPQVGVVDWYPRNQTPLTSTALQEPTLVNTSTGTKQQLILALELATPPRDLPTPASVTATLELNVRADTPKNFKQFTFRFETTFSAVSGVETATEKKTLRFTAYGIDPDLVEVFVNGIKQEQGLNPDQYQIYLGLPGSIPPNTVVFNTPVALAGTTQVDVIVSKVAALTTRTLTFFKNRDNPARTNTGAWENVDSFSRFVGGTWRTFYIFTFDVLNTVDMDLNTIMVPSIDVMVLDDDGAGDVIATSVLLSSAFFMLARKPYTTLDRYPDICTRLDTLSTDRDYLKYHLVNNVATLEITETSIAALYPPARLVVFDPELTIKTPVAGYTEQIVIDGRVIVGPDA